ncbi:hypothetical protein Rhe02_69050 [Rhizocola hellebori]|uniref:Uncharacterized protein n=1 Tax=Rhizocola hellebori TaxID=1392758 RepID=A0A8J3QDE8_9ACTN|nr:hypothetical protein [Rhizocola hellebori]GIH08838.1 hypothetical protein Rhe02_69050 [Rhizocola hellebori]
MSGYGMTGLMAMRLSAYVRAQVALAPLLVALAILGIFYGGGQAEPAEAYGMSAVVLFPIFAWQVKILLDVEPDVQRHIAITAVGSRAREMGNGLLTGAVTTLVTVGLGMVLPWLLGGVSELNAKVPLGPSLVLGLWAHLVAIPPAVALGALASRPISRSAGVSALVLTGGAVLAIVLGLKGSPVPWLVPPLMATARATVNQVDVSTAALLTLWSLAWSAIAIYGYVRLRRFRP